MLLIVPYCVAIHASYLGSKIVVSLYALHLGASQTTIGMPAALYAIAPLVIGVYSGRIADTRGTRWPLIGGTAAVCAGMLASVFADGVAALVATAVLAGAGFMVFNVAIQTLTGGLGSIDDRVMVGCLLFAAVAFAVFPLSTDLTFMLMNAVSLTGISLALWRQ
jgi:MFS family permease